MRIYEGQIPMIAEEMVRSLVRANELEVEPENVPEVEVDVQSVLREYLRTDREINDAARDLSARSGSEPGGLARIKRQLARERNFKTGEESVEYIIDQLIEMFFHSTHVEEVFGADTDLRKRIAPILKRYMSMDEELDREVRGKIRNLEEGSRAWEIEYNQVMSTLKRKKNLE
jgi:uncharacterized protein